MKERVLQALRLWHKPASDGNPLQTLHAYQRLQQTEQLSLRSASNELLRRALDQLRLTHSEESDILQQRFIDDTTAYVVGNRFNLSEGNIFLKQNRGIHYLAELLCQQESLLASGQRAAKIARLEKPTYTQLFGSSVLSEQVRDLLLTPEPPWIVALEGLGGIGKTALADALTRTLIEEDVWDDVAWVTARQTVMNLGGSLKEVERPALSVEALVENLCSQLLPELSPATGSSFEVRQRALGERLKAARHLIVIDNLETVRDVESLLTTLRTWVNPSKILLTTRQRLLSEPDIAHHPLSELDQEAALQLVRFEAQTRHLPDLLAASDDELLPIYKAVGGNPLALRLTVGQLHIHSLDQVLNDLQQANGAPILNLYSYIYRRAWDALDESSRMILLLMLLTTERGKTLDELTHSGRNKLSDIQLRQGLTQLVTLSLVDSRGDLHERRYTIHSLTRTFLHRDVMKWE